MPRFSMLGPDQETGTRDTDWRPAPGERHGPVTAPAVSLHGLHKDFGPVHAVAGIELEIRHGEFFGLLGPSGSGKTTVLRLVAGFERPTSGRILLEGRDVGRLPPFQRDVNTVFQDYALFPHMSVLDNVAYGLRVRRVPKSRRRRLAEEALATVRLTGYGGRRPSQLSGGEQQRVALARALVNRPKVLLLDEPLGSLDRKLREEMQGELKQLQREVGITFVFVTHDQDEALTMSDRIAVFNHGRVEQVGSPAELYERPSSGFVAGFVGTSNLLDGAAARQILGADGTYMVRPEKIRVATDLDGEVPDGEVATVGSVRDVDYVGSQTRFVVDLDAGGELVALQQNLQTSSMDVLGYIGARVRLRWRKEHNFRIEEIS
ncbi:MAG: ABC transporter ATP-binding protein [Streptosporangiaceae bacterium]